MQHESDFEPVVVAAIVTAAIALLLSTVMVLLIIGVRLWRRSVERRKLRFVAKWEPVLLEAMEGAVAVRLPKLSKLELAFFLELWTHLQEATRGSASENLNAFLAQNISVAQLTAVIEKRDVRSIVITLTALGHLRCREAIVPLLRCVLDPSPVVSFAALRAVLRVDAPATLSALVPAMLNRQDWPISRLLNICGELGANVVTEPLLQRLTTAAPAEAIRLLSLLTLGHSERTEPAVRQWLVSQHDPEILAAAFEFTRAPQDLSRLEIATSHRDWRVRVAAAKALGEIGNAIAFQLVVKLLSDPTWWVRHSAARALTAMLGSAHPKLLALCDTNEDPFARDILRQAMAEAG